MPDQNDFLNNHPTSKFQENSVYLQKVANLSPNILLVIDLQEQQIIYVNKRFKEFLGYDSDYIYEKGPEIFKLVLHTEDYDRRLENFEKCKHLSDDEEREIEVRLRTKNDDWQWFKITEKVFEWDREGKASKLISTIQNIHKQKIWEEKLQEEHRRFRNAQAIGQIGDFDRELPGDTIHCSEEFFRIHGREPVKQGISLQEFVSYVHPDEQDILWSAINGTHATGKPLDIVTRVLHKNGEIRHVHRQSVIIKNEAGIPIRVYGTVQDITERIKAEEERKKSENLMRATEAVAGTGSYEVDLPTGKIHFSDGFFRLFGEIPGSFAPTSEEINRRSHPEDIENVQQTLDFAAENKSPYTYTRRIFRKDGEMRTLQAQGSVITDANGNAVKFIGLVQDITERHKAEEELRKSEERSRNLLKVLQNAPDAYLVLTPDLKITLASEAYLKATYSQREKIVGKNIFDVFPDNLALRNPTGVKNLGASFHTVLSTKKPHRMTIQHYDVRRPNGSFEEKYWSFTNTPVLSTEGNVEYIIHRVLDVSEILKKQADVRGLVNETEMLKTSLEEIKIQAQQLDESRKMLQSVFDASPNSIILYKAIYTEKGAVEDFEFLMFNEFNRNLIGMTDDIIGKRFSHEFPVPGNTEILEQFKMTAETGVPADFEFSYEEDARQHWLHFRATKLNDLLVVTGENITRRKNSEQELLQLKDELAQRAKDRYKKIINSMDEGFCLLEAIFNEADECIDYRFLERNPKFEEQTGLDNAVGKRITELMSIEPYWTTFIGRVAKTGETLRLEHNVEGIDRWIEGYAFRVGNPKEKQVAFIFKNVTERKKAEERQDFFMKFNDALQPLVEPAEIQATAMQMLAGHLKVNRANYAEVLEDGDTCDIGPGYFEQVSPLPRKLKLSDFDPEIKDILNRGENIVIADTMDHYQGADEPKAATFDDIEIRSFIGVPVMRNGKLKCIVAVQQSTSRHWKPEEIKLLEEMSERLWPAVEKAQIEKALRESEQRFRNLVEASALAVWETDADGLAVTDSPTWRAFTGQTYGERIGNGWLDAVHPDDREFAATQWKEAISSKSNVNLEFRVKTADGNYCWTNVKATPILNIEGKIIKWSGMNLDIHDRKEAEDALRKAKEEAEAASRAKEDFVSTMSHEIRTPLNAVIGFTNLLLEQNPRKDQKESLKSLSFSAENLLTLINEILDFSKLEAGKVNLAENRFDLHDLLIGLKKAHQPQALAKNTDLELDLDETIPRRIVTDQLKLSQVLHNLVSNAVKFTEEGDVSISVSLNDQDEDILWLDFSIQDTGIGIAAEKLDHIFDKFSQAEHPNLQNYGGTGLGLSITKLLLGLMGSEIQVESKIGKGSRFYFTLPVKMAPKEAAGEKPIQVQEEIRDLSHLHVLLVEDVEINREIVLQFLENWWQLRPDIAINGKEAVEMAKKREYNLVLMDVRMPVMDGYEATRQIRSLAAYKSTPILALTADRNQEVQQAENATQFTDLLTKPFKPGDLKHRILHYLSLSNKVNLKETKGKILENNSSEETARPGSKPESASEQAQNNAAEPSFDISRYTKMAGKNQEVLLKWISSSIMAFETYKEEFTRAATNNSEKSLSDLVHKNTSSVYYIQANPLARKIEDYRTLLDQPEIVEDNLEEQKLTVRKEFDVIIEGLKSLKKDYESEN